jgi:hypothetical protein
MSFPSDVLLPVNAKYYSFKNDYKYNSNYDITWSFTYSVSNVDSKQQAVVTFLTALSSHVTDVIPGHYNNTKITEPSVTIQVLSGTEIKTLNPFNILTIAIDTTGYSALSSTTRPGKHISQVIPNSITIRDINNSVRYNESLPVDFTINNSTNTLRFRYSNSDSKLTIDYRNQLTTDYTNLTSIQLPFRIYNPLNEDLLFTGVGFCSPLSSSDTSTASMILHNFHSEGVSDNKGVEIALSDVLS